MNKLNEMLVEAAILGLTQVVRQVLKEGKADPKANDSEALWCATYYGRTDCVKLLIPVSDPKDYFDALDEAQYNEHTECAKLLREAINEV